MSMLVQRVTQLLKETKSMDEAVFLIGSAFQNLSPKEAKNTVLDVLDFAKNNMTESELEYRLKERGLTA